MAILCINVVVAVASSRAYAFHWRVISVGGDVSAYDRWGEAWDHQDIVFADSRADARAYVSGSFGSAEAIFHVDVDESSFSLSYVLDASGARAYGSFTSMIELEIVADTEDVPDGEVYIYYDSNVVASGGWWANAEIFVDDVRQLNFGRYEPEAQHGRLGPLTDGSRVRYCRNDDDVYDWAYGSVSAPASNNFNMSLRLVGCGDGTDECPKPVVLLVTGHGSTTIDNDLQSLAATRLFDAGWDTVFVNNPTKEQLRSRLSSSCVRGLHISAHGDRDATSSVVMAYNGPGGMESVAASYFGSAFRNRRMDFIAPLACNQVETDWRGAFSNVGFVDLPVGAVGPRRIITDRWQYVAAFLNNHSIDTPPCPDKTAPANMSQMTPISQSEQGVGTDCPSFKICDSTGCGHEIYPAIACGSNDSNPVNGAIAASAPDGSFTVQAQYPLSWSGATVVFGTSFETVPEDLTADVMTPISRHIAVGASAIYPEILPQSFTITMNYEDADLQAAGIMDEMSLMVYWASGSEGGQFVPAALDTLINSVTFNVSFAGVGGIYGDGLSLVLPATRESLVLHDAAPNPFNPMTTIKYDLPAAGPVRLSVFDIAGRLVRTLVDESMPQGSHEAVWDGRDATGREVGSGSYLARLEFGGRVETVRMGLVR
jgi:hypothetical protein